MMKLYALIIEDDPSLGEIYRISLEQAGYETDLDKDGDHYHAFISARQPNFVILDLHLPFASGSDILREIRAQYPKTVVAVVTADLFKAKDLAGEADHILIKPVSIAHLLRIATSIKETL